MNWEILISDIFQIVIIPLLGLLTGYFIKWVNTKTQEMSANIDNIYAKKYINMLNETITSAVIAINQTYVDSLKAQGAFNKEAQKEAFTRVYNTVIASLNTESLKYLNSIINDLDTYISMQIEAQVKLQKTTSE